MIAAQYQWNIKNVDQPSAEAQQLAEQEKISPIVAQILWNRGYQTPAAAHDFLNPGPDQLHDPNLLHDMQKGVARIEEAIGSDQQITIYGDYDADGVTSTSILYETLNEMGAKVNYYIPNRFTDGYGPNVAAFKKLIAAGTQLLVTVDNGVAGNEAIAAANAAGVDVVVTDHHELPQDLPDAYAIIHPRYPGAEYPFGGLSGAGVAFKVAQALREEIPQDVLDLAAIGTVADLVPLIDENRVLVYFGLQLLKQDERPGLQALMTGAGIKPEELTEQSIGFGIAPRLNALGRLNDAAPAVELLTTPDFTVAKELAKQTEDQNRQRQDLVQRISQEALAQAEDAEHRDRAALVISGHDWHEGVLGIVASKVVESTGKPTLVLNVNEDGRAKGSGRSVAAFNLFAALDPHRDILTAFGGHHMAVGLTLPSEQLTALADALDQEADKQQLTQSGPEKIPVAATLDVAAVTPSLYQELAQLAPFGTDNSQPLFAFETATLTEIKAIGKDKSHLKFQLQEGGHRLNAIQFGAGKYVPALTAAPSDAAVLGVIEDNVWQGRHSLQVMVKDLRLTESPVLDQRTTQLHRQMFQAAGKYVFFHQNAFRQLANQLATDATAVLYDGSAVAPLAPHTTVYLVDCPDATTDLEQALQQLQPEKVVAYLYKKESLSQLGMPTRSQYAKLFKFVATHQQVDVGHQLAQLATFLQIPRTQLIFMIQVFFECGFITIDHGVMNGVSHPEHKDLTAAPSYQLRQQQVQTEQDLLTCSTAALTKRLASLI
ncbi:single-stranded-DNA-specific exonuclease RecJ [Levilactobacillus tujiorum]|uniref:Single-stranded-DNA-specific exonuclease RecJ n=1 Tax=Levilactobacillus tujiorum TaxID=2912243 RepID=A0ABX1L2M0_9LACO|nr:single-stranded-DNA-specific exonuclease RecJ [Levilactobacillus tujiorum]NLR11265.1 single-stranded-DNA-specific exonuclease RecJ [Lactobacillus sp. HBUAS51387]NLR29281.1 single-stranded-DNA-specific exonuclease RecJ [Levilactobacillus tujiorum]